MKKILITGINGFAASHLARYLVNEGNEVHGTVRVRSDLHRIEDIKDNLKLHFVELTDYVNVEKVILDVKPEEIYHLAAQSTVGPSWIMPLETFRINVEGTINLLESCRKLIDKPAILNISTMEVYGEVDGIVDEKSFPNPNSPYGISKYAQEMIGRAYAKAYSLSVITSRSFNITGPGRIDAFVDSSFAKQIAEIELGIKEPVVKHGNLSTSRDFVDVRDAVNGYVMMLRSQMYGEIFCMCSGVSRSMQYLLDTLIGLSINKSIRTEIDPSRFRPIDIKFMEGNCDKLKSFWWKPEIQFEKSMEDLLNYWRNKLTK